jgi:hypothetical protein
VNDLLSDLSCGDSDLHTALLAVTGHAGDEEGHAVGEGDVVVASVPHGGVAGQLAQSVLHAAHLHHVMHAWLLKEHCTQTYRRR